MSNYWEKNADSLIAKQTVSSYSLSSLILNIVSARVSLCRRMFDGPEI